MQTGFFNRMREIVERHGGTVEKFIGDEVMAVFGIPAVHADDALRAVRAAQEMQDALPQLGLQARIGINTGEVLAGDPEQSLGLVAGEPVIVAKRLEQGAAAGEIIIGRATYALVQDAVSAGPLERIPVKGKSEDVGRRRIKGVDLEAPGVARRMDLPLVGRGEELELLRGAFARAVEDRTCRLFTVLGPAGIGKSRLATELMSSVQDRATTAIGRCLPYGEGITFWPLSDLLRDLGGADIVAEVLGEHEHREAILELLRAATASSGTAASTEETFWAVRRSFEALACRRPLVVCFEDLHWAEPTLLDLIEYVLGWSRDAPILILVLARPELVEGRPTWIAPHANVDALALEPLSSADAESLLVGLAAEIDLSSELRQQIGVAAEGNPLFLEQMAAIAADESGEGVLRIPPTIHALLNERLDRLSPDERDVIGRASVVGRDFPMAAVAGLFPEGRRAPLTPHLLSLVRKGLVRPDPSASAESDRFSFHHVLIRDCAYEALPKELRAELHERLADVMEQDAGGLELEEILGYHLEQAYAFRIGIGLDGDRAAVLAERAAAHLLTAGRRALARGNAPAAASLLQRARPLHEVSGQKPTAILIELGAALRECARLSESDAALAEAIEASRTAGDRSLEARAEIEQCFTRLYSDVPPLAEFAQLADRVAAVAPDDDLVMAKARTLAGLVQLTGCRMGAAEISLEQAWMHAQRVGERPSAQLALAVLARTALFGPRPVGEALARTSELAGRAHGDPLLVAPLKTTQAALEAMRGRFPEARALYAEAHVLFTEFGRIVPLAGARMDSALVERLAGDLQAAERELRAGVEASAAVGEKGNFSTLAGLLAETLVEQGKLDEAEHYLELSDETTPEHDVFSEIARRLGRAMLLLQRELLEDALAVAREACELAEETDVLLLQADTLVALGRVLHACDDREGAERAIREAERRYEAKGDIVSAARIRSIRVA